MCEPIASTIILVLLFFNISSSPCAASFVSLAAEAQICTYNDT